MTKQYKTNKTNKTKKQNSIQNRRKHKKQKQTTKTNKTTDRLNNAVNRREANRESMEPKSGIPTPERDRAALEEMTN